MTEDREPAHELIDRLPETQLAALRIAPIDDEAETDDEKRDVAEARQWLRTNGGKGIRHEEAMRRLGL